MMVDKAEVPGRLLNRPASILLVACGVQLKSRPQGEAAGYAAINKFFSFLIWLSIPRQSDFERLT